MDIIFDIDGTLADITHRLAYVQTKPKNWKAFDQGVSDDAPNSDIIRLQHRLTSMFKSSLDPYNDHMLIASGRSDRLREETVAWLKKYNIDYDKLYMRKEGDFRKDSIIKREILDEMRADGYDPKIAIDDRQQVVDMWREAGLTCLQCARGDF